MTIQKAVFRGTTTTFRATPKDQNGDQVPALDVAKLYIRQGDTLIERDLEQVGAKWLYNFDTGLLRAGIANWAIYVRQGLADAADRIEISTAGVLNVKAASPAL